MPEKVTLSDPVQRTVRATVLAIDEELNQIKLQTEEGQRLMLFLPPESLARLRIGTPCLLQVAVQSMRESRMNAGARRRFLVMPWPGRAGQHA